MEKINSIACLNLLRDRFPKFIPLFEADRELWVEEEGKGMLDQMIPFSKYALGVIKINDINEMKKIFDFAEFLMLNGDESVQKWNSHCLFRIFNG